MSYNKNKRGWAKRSMQKIKVIGRKAAAVLHKGTVIVFSLFLFSIFLSTVLINGAVKLLCLPFRKIREKKRAGATYEDFNPKGLK